MKSLYSLVALLALAVPTIADEVMTESATEAAEVVQTADITEAKGKADRAYGVKYAEERVFTLPSDQGKLFLTVIGKPGETRYEEIRDWFKTNKRLKGLATQVHFNAYPSGDPIAKDRFPGVKKYPFIRLQNKNAQRLFEVAGNDIPMSPDALANAIEHDVTVKVKEAQGITEGPLGIFGRRNNGNCPDCDNANNRRQDRQDQRQDRQDRRHEVPDEDEDPQPLDENDGEEEEVAPHANLAFPLGLAVLVGAGAFLFGGWPYISTLAKKAVAPIH